jgi:hypothetical protein
MKLGEVVETGTRRRSFARPATSMKSLGVKTPPRRPMPVQRVDMVLRRRFLRQAIGNQVI